MEFSVIYMNVIFMYIAQLKINSRNMPPCVRVRNQICHWSRRYVFEMISTCNLHRGLSENSEYPQTIL